MNKRWKQHADLKHTFFIFFLSSIYRVFTIFSFFCSFYGAIDLLQIIYT